LNLVAELSPGSSFDDQNEDAMGELAKAIPAQTVGIGDITAARVTGRTGRPSRFPDGVGQPHICRHRASRGDRRVKTPHVLSWSGDRQLTSAGIPTAVKQIRITVSLGTSTAGANLATDPLERADGA
jgi:hypothetical protein